MRYSLTIFVHRVIKTGVATVCLGGMLASGELASGQVHFQEGGSRLYLGRVLSPEDEPADHAGTDAHTDPEPPHGNRITADGDRALRPTVAMKDGTLSISSAGGSHKVYIIGVEGKPGAMTVHVDDLPMQLFFDVQHVDIDFAGGSNYLAVYQIHIAGDVMISAGVDNELQLGRPPYHPNAIGGNLVVTLGDGDNKVRLEESWIFGNVTMEAGDGDNRITLGRSDTTSDLGAVIFGDLWIATGDGPDRVEAAKCWLGGNTTIDTAGGDDAVTMGTHYEPASPVAGNVLVGSLDIATGIGADAVGLTDNEVGGETDIALGDDDDLLLLGAGLPPNSFYSQFWARGNDGQDTLDDDAANYFEFMPHFQSFELP